MRAWDVFYSYAIKNVKEISDACVWIGHLCNITTMSPFQIGRNPQLSMCKL